jgi:hypothetical protein
VVLPLPLISTRQRNTSRRGSLEHDDIPPESMTTEQVGSHYFSMIGCLWMALGLASKKSNRSPLMGYYLGGYLGVILRVSEADDKC